MLQRLRNLQLDADDAFEHLQTEKDVARKIARLGLKEKRSRVLCLSTLHDLTLRTIFSHADFFTSQPKNPFANLPKTLMQNLFDMSKTCEEEVDKCAAVVDLLLRVPNSSLRSMDILSLEDLGEDNCDKFLQLALRNCPHLEHLAAPCPILPSAPLKDTFQFTWSIVRGCSKLRSLDLMGFFVSDAAIKLIAKKLPNLQMINLCIDKRRFTRNGASWLQKLKMLTHLKLNLRDYNKDILFFMMMLIELVWVLPNLQHLHLSADHYNDTAFLSTHFAHFWSTCNLSGKLNLSNVAMMQPLQTEWPSNLHTDSLFVHLGLTGSPKNLSNLFTMPCGVSELVLINCIYPDTLYNLLQQLGPQLKRLRLLQNLFDDDLLCHRTLNLYKVMSLCPALEHLSLSCPIPLESTPRYNLTPENFVNIKSFEYGGECRLMKRAWVKPFFDLFKMVLMGSKVYKVLELQNRLLLKKTALFLASNPDCLTQVEVFNAVYYKELGQEDILTIGKLLMLRSPHLHTIEIHYLDEEQLPKWFQWMASSLGVQVDGITDVECAGIPNLNPIHLFFTSNKNNFSDPSDGNRTIWHHRYFLSDSEILQRILSGKIALG